MVLETEESRPGDPWETLPIKFLIKVLRDHGLPVSTLATCRSVCKKWMEIVDGPYLRSKIWNEHVLAYYDTEGTAYFCCSDQWITRNITFESKRLVAADGGLLCFNNRLSTEYVLYNPVPDRFLTLNVPHEIDGTPAVIDGMMECVVVGLVVDRSTKHFKLLLGGVLLPDERRTLIYDSMIGTWSWLSHPFPAESKVRWKVGRSVACGGRLYWLLWKCTSLGMYLRKALVIFDLREEKWKAFVEKVNKHEAFLEKVEDIPYDADESQKRLRAIDAYPLANWWLHRHKYSAAFLSHPKVRAMDGALVGPRKWDGKEGRPFLDCAAGVSDAIFVDEEFDDPVVAKYWAR
ncbi:hypothetical protein MPTK2_4g18720 [Marchantia polymorpha subsp. ruderalis]